MWSAVCHLAVEFKKVSNIRQINIGVVERTLCYGLLGFVMVCHSARNSNIQQVSVVDVQEAELLVFLTSVCV